MKNIMKTLKYLSVFMLLISFSGCTEDDVVLPQITAGFTHTINPDTGTVVFINTSENASAYMWNFGDTTSSTEINPIKTYASGTFTIVLTASNVAGASSTFEDTIVINVPIPPVPVVLPVITLIGNATISQTEGTAYTDEGATASDIEDGDITSSIVVGGDTVDSNTPGTYTITYNVSDSDGNAAAQVTRSVIITEAQAGPPFDDGLLTNGDFENGTTAWSGNALNVLTEGGNSFNFANVEVAGDNAFDVNLSQVVEMTQGKNYRLSFEASTDDSRTMLVGIGQSVGPFISNTQSVSLTTTNQPFTFDLSTADFGGADSRVIFDMGADAGVVVIDNVSLICLDCNSGGGTGGAEGEFATNGDFETGDETGWFVFQNGGTAGLDNTISNGGSWSAKIETGGASNPAFKQERIAVGTVTAGDVVNISFDHIGTVMPEGGVFNVLLFGETSDGASFTHVFSPAPTLTDSWTSFSESFTIPAGTDVSGGISLLIESVCGGAAGCSVSANIDNVSITLN